jgi:hypothetical protein
MKSIVKRYERLKKFCEDPFYNESLRKKKCRLASLLGEKLGLLKRPSRCTNCNKRCYLYRHHINYNDPINVIFLCKRCHEKADRELWGINNDNTKNNSLKEESQII